MHVPKKVLATSALMGTAEQPKLKSIFLDGHTTYNPNITIGGMF